jgi:hypothetical protein
MSLVLAVGLSSVSMVRVNDWRGACAIVSTCGEASNSSAVRGRPFNDTAFRFSSSPLRTRGAPERPSGLGLMARVALTRVSVGCSLTSSSTRSIRKSLSR